MGAVHGTFDPAFSLVERLFARYLALDPERGGAVEVDGRVVVDLWGGRSREAERELWAEDTLACAFSVTKSLVALCAHRAVERGELDLDRSVADYWPEFAAAGKEAISVRTLLGGLAGLPYADAAPDGSLFDHEAMASALAQQAPEWTPGTQGAYHGPTYGTLVDELLRRATGRAARDAFREELAEPLGLDVHIGVDDDALARCAALVQPQLRDSLSLPSVARGYRPLPRVPDVFSTEAFRRSGWTSGGAHATARSLARLYGLLAAARAGDEGGPVLGVEATRRMATEQWYDCCGYTGRLYRYGLGVFLNHGMMPMGLSRRAFGHAGLGGAIAFADPDARIGFAFVPRVMTPTEDVGADCRMLVEAAALPR